MSTIKKKPLQREPGLFTYENEEGRVSKHCVMGKGLLFAFSILNVFHKKIKHI